MFDKIKIDIQNFKDWINSGREKSYSDFTQDRIDAAEKFDNILAREIELFSAELSDDNLMSKLKAVPNDQLDGYILCSRNISHLNPDPLIIRVLLKNAKTHSKHIKMRYVESTQNLEVYLEK